VAWHIEDSASRDEWSLADCFRILYRHKAAVAGLTCLGILAAAAVSSVQKRVYQAHANIEVQPFNEAFLDLRDIYPAAASSVDAPTYLQTQTELLQQDSLLEQVVHRLHLEDDPDYRGRQGAVAKLRQDIRIAPLRASRIIQIAADARTAPLAADLANAIALTFIEQGIRERQASARQTYRALLPQLEELRRAVRPVGAGRLSAAQEVNRHLYDSVAQKAYHAQLASTIPLTNIRLASPAMPPLIPDRPNTALNLAIGAVGGLLLAVAVVMLKEQRKPVLRAPGDAGIYLALPELGAIPQANTWSPSAMLFPRSSAARLRVERAALEERAGLSESFRATVASILSARNNGSGPRVLLVTSSQPTEGKTTIVSNLGIALAGISNKVLLIDGDMRRPRLHKLFDEPNSWGLSDVLREKNAVDELPLEVLAKRTSVPHLYLLPSGAATDNIFGLLHSGRLSRLLPIFREAFDFVLVDAPPCLEFADARIMARHAEELLLVVRANYTDRRTVQTAVHRLRCDNLPLMGVILNRWNSAPGDPYAYRPLRPVERQVVS
jgi:succinoglycan biosynthesis transport protein ExoP